MAHLAEEPKDIKNTVRNAVKGYAETVKQWDKDTEKHIVEAQTFSKLFVEPEPFNVGTAPTVALIFALVVMTGATGALGFLFTRESALRKQAGIQLELVQDEQSKLEQSAAKLRTDAELRQTEIQKLTLDLKEANARAALAGTVQSQNETEITRVRSFYEAQITALKEVVRMRDRWARNFQSQLEAIRRLLERSAVSGSVGAAVPQTSTETLAPNVTAPSAPPLATANVPVTGKVLAVDFGNRFIVTDLGPVQGAQAGSVIQIYHGQDYLGQARIDRTYQDLSAATVISDDLLERVQEGDQAFLTLG